MKNLIGKWIAAATLPRALSVILLTVSSIQAMGIAKTLFGPESSASASPIKSREATPGDMPMLDLKAIQQAELFGSLTQEPVPKALATQLKTRLDVKLLGVVKGSQGNTSVAILVEAGRQRAYAVNDRLSVNNGARLAEILADRVVLDVSGQQQYVELEKPAMKNAKISVVTTGPVQASRSLQRDEAEAASEGIRVTVRRNEQRRDTGSAN